MKPLYGLKEEVLVEIISFAKTYEIETLYLFGSRARGDYKERSDIDLAVEGGNTTLFSVDIDEEVNTLLMFDVVDLKKPIQIELLEAIQKEGVVLYEKEGKFQEIIS